MKFYFIVEIEIIIPPKKIKGYFLPCFINNILKILFIISK